MLRFVFLVFSLRRTLRYLRAELKALKAEHSALLSTLKVERLRHQQREEELLDRCLQAAGQHALSKTQLTPTEQQIIAKPAPQRILTDHEREERDQWGEFAVEAGQDKQAGLLRWDREHGF